MVIPPPPDVSHANVIGYIITKLVCKGLYPLHLLFPLLIHNHLKVDSGGLWVMLVCHAS